MAHPVSQSMGVIPPSHKGNNYHFALMLNFSKETDHSFLTTILQGILYISFQSCIENNNKERYT